jgi:enoyl reductase-like protein
MQGRGGGQGGTKGDGSEQERRRDCPYCHAKERRRSSFLFRLPVSEDRNKRIKEFYWKLWYGDDSTMPDLGIHDIFTGPEVTIQAADVEQFCAVVGNAGESFKTARSESVSAPMDFAIVTGWQVRICSCLIDHFSFSM